MIYVLGSNDLSRESMFGENGNFQLSLLEETVRPPRGKISLKITTFYNQADDILNVMEDYGEGIVDSGDEYQFEQVPYIDTAVKNISELVKVYYEKNVLPLDEEDRPDVMFALCIAGKIGTKIEMMLNKYFHTNKMEIRVMSLYRLYGASNTEEMTKIMKNKLGTEFIYSDDPLFFTYSAYISMGIGRTE